MRSTVARDSSWNYFRSFSNKRTKGYLIFVIHKKTGLSTKTTPFALLETPFIPTAITEISLGIIAGLGEKAATIKDLVPTMYAEVDKRLWRAAANSVYSHLLALHREGRAQPLDGSPSLSASWRLA